jgi:hypothetical protein
LWRLVFLHLSRMVPRPTQPPVQWVLGAPSQEGKLECGNDDRPLSSAKIKERVELHL